MKLRQYRLRSKVLENADGYMELVVWLEDGRAKVGDYVTLEDATEPERKWQVVEAYNNIDHDKLQGGHKSKDWHKNDI